MPPSVPQTPQSIERELRGRLTAIEYRTLQSRLTGAIRAIAFLRDRAPDLLPLMFGETLDQARVLPAHTQSALVILIEELLGAAVSNTSGRIDRRKLLRLVARWK